nr:DUF2752 domain-containing protein [Fulvivirga imtechensis]
MNKIKNIWQKFPFEAVVWLSALAYFAIMDPGAENHFTICPLGAFGFDHCPGCGLGRSISLIFHGRLRASFQMHPLGLLAIIILSYRAFMLIYNTFKTKID